MTFWLFKSGDSQNFRFTRGRISIFIVCQYQFRLDSRTRKRPALRSQKKANKMLLVKSLVYYLVIKMCQASFLKNIKCTSFLKRLTKRESCVHYHKTCDRIDDRDNKPTVKSCISEAVYICYLVVTY